MKLVLVILMTVSITSLFGQRLVSLKYSECLGDCKEDSSKIKHIEKSNRLTTIVLMTYAPCSGNFGGRVSQTKESINLEFFTKPTIYKDDEGIKHKLIEIADCNCLVDFTWKIRGLSEKTLDKILVNNLTLEQIENNNRKEEITIE